ncbi:hypothetical protein F4778DRAFT_800436 [Xylariomycetidae sp. FL2044]|nr:hypothetical protein F4778DRAFT_800436 [Xylariomycetidae sp. FL2044]
MAPNAPKCGNASRSTARYNNNHASATTQNASKYGQPSHQRPYHHHHYHHHHQPSSQNWRLGDVAFLKHVNSYSQADYDTLIQSGYLAAGATCHPVVVLEKSPDEKHYLVSTISAYSSGADNGNLAPWNQRYHQAKHRDDFRAFVGSERPGNSRQHLRLEGGKLCPKPKTSWMYIQAVQVVPHTVLGKFDKSPDQLRMTQESHADLMAHMRSRSRDFDNRWTRYWALSAPSAGTSIAASTTTNAAAAGAPPASVRQQTWGYLAQAAPTKPRCSSTSSSTVVASEASSSSTLVSTTTTTTSASTKTWVNNHNHKQQPQPQTQAPTKAAPPATPAKTPLWSKIASK